MPDYLSELALLLSCTAFIKIATVFSALRYGLGLNDMVFGVVSLAAALVFAFVIPLNSGTANKAGQPFWQQVEQQRSFLEKHSDPETVVRLDEIRTNANPTAKTAGPKSEEKSLSIESLLAAFLISELQEAFQLGLLLLIPLVVIDLLVVNVLALLEVTQISAVLISLPLKIGLFVGAGGWNLLIEKLLTSYGG